MDAALKVASESEFDALMGPRNRAAEIRKRYQEVKTEFQTTVCENCGTKRTQPSWDMDAPAMVHKLGGLYRHFYLPNYSVPNFHIHATLASSTFEKDADSAHREADLQVVCAIFLMLLSLRFQESIFHLGLERALEACEQAIVNLRPQREQS